MRSWRRRDLLLSGPIGLLGGSGLLSRGHSQGASGSEISFTDPEGQNIVLHGPARRIVDLRTTVAAFAIAAHGSASRLIGINRIARSMFERGLIGRLFPEILTISADVVAGDGTPNVEGLINLNPDIVVDWSGSGRDTAAVLRKAGLTVVSYDSALGSIAQTIETLLYLFGRMIGDTTRAQRITSTMREMMARLAVIQNIPMAERPKVLIIMFAGDRIYASGDGFDTLIRDAGGRNVAGSVPGLVATNPEQISAWDPDVILLFQTKQARPELVLNHSVLAACKASTARRVYVLPLGANNWGSMGPDEFLAAIWLAELLYPGQLAMTLRGDMEKAYFTMFGHTLTAGETDSILRMDLNGSSAAYSRFGQR
ncbi:MAG: ABC transporter substrate-binding protein [Parvibaculaceae bacterium]